MTVFIIHGLRGHAGIGWQQWLHDRLKDVGYKVLMPDLPEPEHPDRRTWLRTVRNLTADLHPQEILFVAHSLGVLTALDYIERLREPVRALFAVSGFAESYGAEINEYFIKEKKIDFARVIQHVNRTAVFYGDNDPFVPQPVLRKLATALKVKPTIIPDGGHLNSAAGFTTFPALFEAIIHPE